MKRLLGIAALAAGLTVVAASTVQAANVTLTFDDISLNATSGQYLFSATDQWYKQHPFDEGRTVEVGLQYCQPNGTCAPSSPTVGTDFLNGLHVGASGLSALRFQGGVTFTTNFDFDSVSFYSDKIITVTGPTEAGLNFNNLCVEPAPDKVNGPFCFTKSIHMNNPVRSITIAADVAILDDIVFSPVGGPSPDLPEPSSIALSLAALCGLAVSARRRT